MQSNPGKTITIYNIPALVSTTFMFAMMSKISCQGFSQPESSLKIGKAFLMLNSTNLK